MLIIVYVTKGKGEGEVQQRILFRTYKKLWELMVFSYTGFCEDIQ